MDHPEKEQFEEIRSLKAQIVESRERIFKVEEVYMQKVEEVEKRDEREKRVNHKLEDYRSQIKTMILVMIDNKEIPIFYETVHENIFKCRLFVQAFSKGTKRMVLDMDYKHFDLLVYFLRTGHSLYHLSAEDKESEIDKILCGKSRTLEDSFIQILKENFSEGDFFELVSTMNLDISIIPSTDYIESFEIIGETYINNTIDKYMTKDFNELYNEKNPNAIFLKAKSSLVIKLKTPVRAKGLKIRPFCTDTTFSKTTGNTYTTIYISTDMTSWKEKSKVPAAYGSTNLSPSYISDIQFTSHENFTYVKFQAHASYNFSISYIGII